MARLESKTAITPEILREFLAAESATGLLYWKPRSVKWFSSPGASQAWHTRWAGKRAFVSKNADGYFTGSVLKQKLLAHRVLWAIQHGQWPESQIDHINGDPSDNRLSNLRDIPGPENQKNSKRYATNKSGCSGVRWRRNRSTWIAEINSAGRTIYLGSFHTLEEAIRARKASEPAMNFHPNHGRDGCFHRSPPHGQ